MQHADDAPGTKAALRVALLAARRARSAEALTQARREVREVVLARQSESGWACVAAYQPLRTEPGSVELLAALAARSVRVLVPVTLPDRDLDWVEWGGAGVPLGREAVVTADAVLLPALAVATDGTRLGRGGGSYDRALRRAGPAAPRVALLFDDELVDTLPADAWDVPVTDVVQPRGWSSVGGRGLR